MRRAYTIIAIFVVLSELVFTPSAYADDNTFDCSAYASVMSRALWNHLGTYATRGPALTNFDECVHTQSGLYGNVFLLVPFEKFHDGKEGDIRFGYRREVLGIDVDGSVAWYGFTDGAETFQTLDVQLRLARMFPLSPSVKLELYGMGDYQHSLTLGTNALGLAAGVSLGIDIPLPGTPNLKVGAEVWKYAFTPDPGKGPHGSFTADLGFKIPGSAEIVIGPRAQFTVGDVDERHSGTVRSSFGVFVSVPFGF